MAEAVGFIGLGIMGSLQAANLARDDRYELRVYNRTRSKAEDWVGEFGGSVAGTPREAAQGASVVITMVVDGAQVRDVLLGEDGALAGAEPDTLFIDCSTIAPGDARALAEEVEGQGHAWLDAPVTGSSPKAKDGTLTIMCGGSDAAFERARPLLEVMGEKIVRAGEAGQGQAVKVLTQGVTAVNCVTLAQAIVLARTAGIDLDALLETMDGGSSDSTMRALKGQAMVDDEFPKLFKLEHMLKDVGLCLAEARTAGGAFPLAALAGEFYGAGMGHGLADEDFGTVYRVIEALSGLESKPAT